MRRVKGLAALVAAVCLAALAAAPVAEGPALPVPGGQLGPAYPPPKILHWRVYEWMGHWYRIVRVDKSVGIDRAGKMARQWRVRFVHLGRAVPRTWRVDVPREDWQRRKVLKAFDAERLRRAIAEREAAERDALPR